MQTQQRKQAWVLADIELSGWVGLIGLAVTVGIVYFVAARLSLALLTKPEGVAVFWPAAGVAAGVLIAIGPRGRWPVVVGTMAATIVANLLGDRNIGSAVLFALCNAGEAVLAAWIVQRYFGPDFRLHRLRNVVGLVLAALAGSAISAIGGTIAIRLFHNATAPLFTTWQTWFASDGLGIITVAPLLIELASVSRDRLQREERIEGVLAVASITVVSGLARRNGDLFQRGLERGWRFASQNRKFSAKQGASLLQERTSRLALRSRDECECVEVGRDT